MKYLFVNTHFLPDSHYGGVVASGSKLYKYLRRLGDVRLVAVGRCPEKAKEYIGEGDKVYRSVFSHSFGISFALLRGLFGDIAASDAVLVNGIFTFPVTLAALYATILNKPFIVATRGGLEPWRVAHKKWKKYFYIKLITLPLMRKARYIHVTSEQEERNIRALGFERVMRVTNGIDLEEYAAESGGGEVIRRDSRFKFLFLSRTDKEKGVDILVSAYRKFCTCYPKEMHLLKIIGPDHQSYLSDMGLDYKAENIERIEGVYGIAKRETLENADVLVLPSYSENFGNVVAEAMACSTPVITTTGTPWSEIEKVGCGLYIEPNVDELFSAMEKIYAKTPEERKEMGRLGREYVLKNFNWEDKAKVLFQYLQLVSGEKKV